MRACSSCAEAIPGFLYLAEDARSLPPTRRLQLIQDGASPAVERRYFLASREQHLLDDPERAVEASPGPAWQEPNSTSCLSCSLPERHGDYAEQFAAKMCVIRYLVCSPLMLNPGTDHAVAAVSTRRYSSQTVAEMRTSISTDCRQTKWEIRPPIRSAGAPRGLERVPQQAGDRHRPDAARYRRDRAGHLRGLLEGHVADEAALAVRARSRAGCRRR